MQYKEGPDGYALYKRYDGQWKQSMSVRNEHINEDSNDEEADSPYPDGDVNRL